MTKCPGLVIMLKPGTCYPHQNLIFAPMHKPSQEQVFSIADKAQFDETALQIFRFQAQNCQVYHEFIGNLRVDPNTITNVSDIPFLPISFFKTHNILSSTDAVQTTFTSSGTTGMVTSRHQVTDVSWYDESFLRAFGIFYGDINQYCLLALLPSYLERQGSSLIHMVEALVKNSSHPDSGFFLYEHDDLHQKLQLLKQQKTPTILIGVTFALLDFVESHPIDFPELIVMETGGMKGRRKEMIREDLHQQLCAGFGVQHIHSEYGMTELLSQAYSKGDGIFNCPPWMKIFTRDTNDPLSLIDTERTGGINVIDLANINSCSFIATQDLGRIYADGSFEVLGRFDNSDIRGCNLLIG